MFDKILVKIIFVTSICIFVNACSLLNNSEDSMFTEEEQAQNHLQLGVRYLDMGMLESARENLEIALQLDSDNEETYNALAVLSERLKQKEKARDYYQKALDINADNASLRHNYGRFLCETGDYKAGIELLKQALDMPLNKKKWLAYTNLGRCELQHGQQQLAESYLRQALQINNSNSAALSDMQKISYKAGKYMSSRAFLERYLAVAKHSPETLWYAMRTEQALGNKELAEKYREMLFTLFPASKEALQIKTAIW